MATRRPNEVCVVVIDGQSFTYELIAFSLGLVKPDIYPVEMLNLALILVE